MNEKALYEIGRTIKKQLYYYKNSQQNVKMFVYLVTNRAPQDKMLSNFMKIINGYNLKVDLNPFAKIINTNDFHRGMQAIVLGLLSE